MTDSPLALLVVLAALIAVPMVLRRFKANTPDAVRVVGRTALTKGAVVAVVAVGGRRLLVGANERGVQLLTELDGDVDASAADAAAFDLSATSTSLSSGYHPPQRPTRMDAVRPSPQELGIDLTSIPGATGEHLTAGPRIGLVDRLRAMTVRTPVQGRPFHVPFRR